MFKRVVHSNIGAAVLNMAVAYLVWMLSRVAFFAENWSTFAPYMSWSLFKSMLHGSLVFDTSALLYVNALYLALMLLPMHLKERPGFHKALKWLFVVTNAVAIAMNLMDAVYFQYTGRRSTVTVFTEFANEGNIMSIILTEFVRHWYLVLAFAALVFILWRCYTKPRLDVYRFGSQYYISQAVALVVMAPLAIVGIRGSVTAGTRPITISNANQFVNRPVESSVVLNTPFSMIRSIGKKAFVTPDYMPREQMEAIYTPVHDHPESSAQAPLTKNVVILIVESMGKEYIGTFNHDLDGGRYKGYMPFIDSLVERSMTFEYSYANGRISMDAMPSILSGLPMMVESIFLTPASLNDVDGISSMLDREGYSTAFFHGGHNISMGFSAYAHSIGYKQYYGLDEYCKSPKYGGMDDFDGKWAIWDEPFLQYYATKMSEMKEPFMTAVFTASSHHPYAIPEKYKAQYPEEGIIIHKCIRYTDMAIGKFFEKVSREPWFNNTIFVLTSDHTNLSDHEFYQTDIGGFCSPIIIYEPGNAERQPEIQDKIAQQIDILPTILGMLHYQKPYFGFGIDVLNTPAEDTWAVNYLNGIYQYVKHNYVLQFDGQQTKAVYALNDSLMKTNLLGKVPQQPQMERELKAIIQQYMERMTQDRLTPTNP